MARNYAALPHEYLEEWEGLTEAEIGRLVIALLKYSATGEVVKLSGNEKYLFPRVRAQEDRFRASYEETSVKRSEAGKKGASKRWQGKAKDSKAIHPIANDSKNGYTETDTDIPPAIAGGEDTPAPAREPEPEGEKEADPLYDPELERVMTFFLDKLNAAPPAMTIDGLKFYTGSLGADVVIHAMEICLGEKKTGWSYLRRILMRYEQAGLRSLEAVLEDEQQYQKRKEASHGTAGGDNSASRKSWGLHSALDE